jgi:hypothetical protein
MTTSFREWLEAETSREDDIGRFARDVTVDTEAPQGDSRLVWEAHLKERGAGPGATLAFRDAWAQYTGER